MFVVVQLYLSMTLEADGDGVVSGVWSAVRRRFYMMDLDLDPAETVADAAAAVAVREEPGDVATLEGQGLPCLADDA